MSNISLNAIDIDLLLHERPAHISVYKWCKQRARALVNEKRNRLLQMLNASQRDWESEKIRLRNFYMAIPKKTQTSQEVRTQGAFPEKIRRCIKGILGNPYIQINLGIEEIGGETITFARKEEGCMTANDRYKKVFINPNCCRFHSDQEIQSRIGHELAHIKRRHRFEQYCMQVIYKKRGEPFPMEELKNRSSESISTKDEVFFEFIKAQEIEADIVGIFNDPSFARARYLYFLGCSGVQNTLTHPTNSKRAAYFKEISQYMVMKKRQEDWFGACEALSIPSPTSRPRPETWQQTSTERDATMRQLTVAAAATKRIRQQKITSTPTRKRRPLAGRPTTQRSKDPIKRFPPATRKPAPRRRIGRARKQITEPKSPSVRQLIVQFNAQKIGFMAT